MRRVIAGAASLWTQRLAQIALNLALTPVLFATIDQEALGVWILINTAIGLLALLDFGLSSTLPRWFAFARGRVDLEARSIDDEGVISQVDKLLRVGNSLYLRRACLTLIVGAALGVVFFAFADISAETRQDAQIAWAIILVGQALLLWDAAWVRALTGFGYISWTALLGSGVASIGVLAQIVVASMGYGIIGLACAAAPIPVIARYLAIWLFKRRHPEIAAGPRPAYDRDLVRALRGPSYSAWIVTASNYVSLRLDMAFVAMFVGVEAVPLYFALMQISNAVTRSARAVGAATQPMLSQLWSAADGGDKASAQARFALLFERSSAVGLGLAAIGAALVAAFDARIFATWLGVAPPMQAVVLLVCLRMLVDTMQTLSLSASRSTEHEVFARLSVICAALSAPLALTLGPWFGVAGLVLANLVARGATMHTVGVVWSLKRVGPAAARGFLRAAMKAMALAVAAFFLGLTINELDGSNAMILTLGGASTAALGAAWWWFWASDAAARRRILSLVRRPSGATSAREAGE